LDRVKDPRIGQGRPQGDPIRMPTLRVPTNCSCTWTVVKTGPGMQAVSELRYRNSLCSAKHPEPAAVVSHGC
jgi:hypothetical protein